MTDYIKTKELFKGGNEVDVQPMTIDAEEKFSIWSVKENKFYNTGDYINIDGKEIEVNKYIKLTDEQKKKYSRSLKFARDIIFNGTEYRYDMPKTMNDALIASMKTIQATGQNPLDFTFKLSRKVTGSNAWDVEYSVIPNPKQKFDASEELVIDLDEDEIELTEKEEKVVKLIKQKVPNYTDIDVVRLKKPLFQNVDGMTEERANKIVNHYLR